MLDFNRHLLILTLITGLSGCSIQPSITKAEKKPEILVVQSDGSFVLNNRNVKESDVVIYEDGYGGERAAVKVHNPLHPAFYRDTIIVKRE